ncbi:STAS domain-containing protein [Donghicola sp.]|uniref:STAS domain-containing protein n=1 Tax=Donghicola sp. TaxID=1929294 RepID=UPI0025D89E27|nr:STAS domain-containing protein [Donghicola sp.]MCT4575991.1 STAS domain-containing protein [Donghicola sp.]
MASDSLSTLTLEPDDWLDDPETAIGALSAAVATGEVCVDASGPRMLPAQVLQMLISARKSVEAQGGRFVLRAPSDGVVRSLTVLGCADYFEGALQ